MTRLFILSGVLFVNIIVFEAHAMTPEQKAAIHEHFETLGIECIKDNVISESDINNLRSKKVATGDNVPCFLACLMKKVGILDNVGMLHKENVLEYAKKIFEDDEELQLIHDYLHSCAHVNSETVGDGEKGCERAMKAYICMIENASQFGIDI